MMHRMNRWRDRHPDGWKGGCKNGRLKGGCKNGKLKGGWKNKGLKGG